MYRHIEVTHMYRMYVCMYVRTYHTLRIVHWQSMNDGISFCQIITYERALGGSGLVT